MFRKSVGKVTKLIRSAFKKPAAKNNSRWNVLVLERLESRDVPAPLAWSAGASLPTAGGIAVLREGSALLVLAGPATTSYNLTATYPSWQASSTATVQPLDFARTSPGVGTLPNGYDIVFGGTENGFAISTVTQYDPNTVTVVDGVTNQTRSLRSMNVPRAEFGWATDTNGLDYAIGGVDNNGTPLSTVEVYSPSANTWTYLAPLPQTLYGESAVSDGAGHIYTFGGVGASGAVTNVVYRYTISSNTWDALASPMQVAVSGSAAVLAPNGLVYVIGGQTGNGATATVESFSISTNSWSLETSLPQPLSSAAAVVDSLGRIEVLGGYDANGNTLATTYVSQEFTQPDAAPAIPSTAVTHSTLNGSYTYQVLSTGNPQATYSLTAAPAGMTINAATGLISWSPTALGSYSVTVQASNAVGQTPQTYSINVVLPTPPAPTGVTGTPLSTTTVGLSWNASPDPYVTSFDVYKQVHVYRSTFYSLVASGITGTSVTLAGSGTYAVTAVNSQGTQSLRSALVSVAVWSPPDLYTATTLSGADISSMTLNVGQTGQIRLIQEFANPAPTYSVVTQPPSGGVSVDSNTGLVTYTPTAADIGNQPVTFAASNVAGSSQFTFYFDVLANNPTVTVSAGPFTYDGNPHAATATAVGTDGVTPVAGSFAFTYNGSPTPPTAADTYAVVTTFTSADPSYANATVNSSLTINPAAPTITLSSGPFTYDGNPHGATATAVGVDGVTPVAGSFAFTYNGSPTAPTGPGLYTVIAAFTSNDPNYAFATVTGNLIINSPGTLTPTLTLVDGSATYDGNPHADSATAVGTDGVTPVSGSFLITYNDSTTAPTQAGSYAVVANFISSDLNYTNATITGSLTISAVAPTITITGSPFYYDTFSQAAYVSEVGIDGVTPVNGTLSALYNGSSTLPVNADTYNVSVTFTSNDSNYLSTTATGSMTIQQAGPSLYYQLNGGAYYYFYNGMPQGVTGIATGYFNNAVNGTFTYAYYDSTGMQLSGPPTAAGYYTFTEYFTSLDPNYTSGTFSYSFAIYAATPTVTVTGGPFTYNGQGQAATATAVGIDGVTPVSGTASFTYNGSSSTPVLAGTYAVVATFTPTDPNYSSSTGSGTLVINKATPAFSNLASPSVNVGTATVTLSGHIAAGSAAPGGDDVAITLNGVTLPATVSGSGYFSATFNVQGLGTGTYAITYAYLGDATRFNAASASGSGTLTVQAAPAVVSNPASQTVVSGQGVTFSASASGYPAPTVQWQRSANGSNWTNISGATSTSYTISATTASQNGYRYRAVFTNAAGSATTAAATLTVLTAPAVTRNPVSQTVTAGQTATFTAAASGNLVPTVQWQVSTDGGHTFANIAGATGTTLTLANTTGSQNGFMYRAVFTNGVGSATTAAATLTVRYAPVVTVNPVSQSVSAGQTVTFTAAATGNPAPTVQWQVSTDGGNTFTNIAGATTMTLILSNTTSSENGYHYRAVFTNSLGSTTTTEAILSVL
jgi:hypothetical protein